MAYACICLSCPAHAQTIQPMKLWYDKPAQFFEESLPVGNGKLGALVYGNAYKDHLYLNDITLWTGKPFNQKADKEAYKYLPAIREALFKEDYRTADRLQRHLQGDNSQYYQPLAMLEMTDHNSNAITDYHRELDLDSALVKIRYKKGNVTYSREYLASHTDSLIAIRLQADHPKAISVSLSLTSLVPHSAKAHGQQITMTGHAIGEPENSIHYCSILKAESPDGRIIGTDSTLTIDAASEVTLYFVNATSFNGFDKHPVREGAPYIDNANDMAWHTKNYTYDQFRQRHIEDYRNIYARMTLRLGGASMDMNRTTEQQLKDYTDHQGGNPYLEQLYFQYGRYLLISSSRTPGVPANLQGLWSPHKYSPWRGNYTMNINLEENYWPADVANMGEMTMPLDGFLKALSVNGQSTAHNYYGIDKGWCASHNSDIWAMTNPVGEKRENPKWANWNMGGAWLVNTLWDHYLFNQDKQYLKDTVYPLMKGAAEFCLAWLIDNPKHPGELITAPSTSPENEYRTGDGYVGRTCYGGTADLAIIRELLFNTAAAAKSLGTDDDFQADISAALNRLHPYQIGKRGNLQEWYYDWDDQDWKHRHQSHLIGLYPGRHITSQRQDLMDACEKSLEIKGDETTGWSTGWRINLWARLHKAEQAYHIFQKLLTYVSPDNYKGDDKRRSGGTYPNLFDAHPPFQIDGNFGGTAGICEMLLYSDGNEMILLPALPKAWPDGEVKGICARGGYTVDMAWKNGKVSQAVLHSKVDGKVKVIYGKREKTVSMKAGQTKRVF